MSNFKNGGIEAAAFEEFSSWRVDQGIGDAKEDQEDWWDCFLTAFRLGVLYEEGKHDLRI